MCIFYLFDNQVIKELTNGGADYCFECIGMASVMQEAFRSSRQVTPLSHARIRIIVYLNRIISG